MLSKLFVGLALSLSAIQLSAQSRVPPPASKVITETAAAELDAVVTEADRLDDKLAIVRVKARAAVLVSLSDSTKSEIMFRGIWKFATGQADKAFDKERARELILKCVYARNPQLAAEFLAEEAKTDESSLEMRATGRDPGLRRTARLAGQLVDEDPRSASELLEQSLSAGVTPTGLNALLRLRERDPLLSDFIAGKALVGLKSQPDVVSLNGLQLLSAYLFPENGAVELSTSLRSLQVKYFSTTYYLLMASLAVPDTVLVKEQHYMPADLRLRSMYQALVTLTLAALAERYQPNLSPELNTLASQLGSRLPDNVAQLAKLTTARLSGHQTVPDNPEMAIPLAIQSGDFEEAGRLIDDLKSDELRKMYSQMAARVEAKSLMAKGDVTKALTRIRKVEDPTARLILYLEAIKVTQKKRDASLSSLVFNEARGLIPTTNRNGLHVRAILSLASQFPALVSTDEAVQFLDDAVIAINSLSKPSDEPSEAKSQTELAWGEINDPASLLDSPEFDYAFSSIGVMDLERAIIEARKITMKSVQLAARLEAAGEVIRIEARRPRSKPTAKTGPRSGE